MAEPHTESRSEPLETAGDSVEGIRRSFDHLRSARQGVPPSACNERLEVLARLERAVVGRSGAIVDAVEADYGHRSRHETLLSEVYVTVASIKYARRRLKRWMRPQRRPVSWPFWPSRARVLHQPLGVVGVISPWNYPFALAALPLVSALAAGNSVLVKPSEAAPHTAELLRELFAEALGSELAAVVTGGPDVAEAFCRLPFDHLFFTGSASTGEKVLRAAAEHLTPVSLELGGKSPAILAEGYPLATFARRVAVGKFFNAGQTCVAPDYVLAPLDTVERLVGELRVAVRRCYPSLSDNSDYTSILNDHHYSRLTSLLEDARVKGATAIPVYPEVERQLAAQRKLAPVLVTGVTDEMRLARDEIFGPILPVTGYRSMEEAIAYIHARPDPLAIYCFDTDRKRAERVLERTRSGGAVINDVVVHAAEESLPFGGVGRSGMGRYHGWEGFETFSNKRSVLYRSSLALSSVLRPPYGTLANRVIRFLVGRPDAAASRKETDSRGG